MFGRKLRKELKELRGVIDDLRREVAFLRGQNQQQRVPYSAEVRADTATATATIPLHGTSRNVMIPSVFASNSANWDCYGSAITHKGQMFQFYKEQGWYELPDDDDCDPVGAKVA